MNRLNFGALAIMSCSWLGACGDDSGDGTSGGGGDASSTGTADGGGDASSTGSGGGAPTAGSPAEGVYIFGLSASLRNGAPILFQGNVTFSDDPDAPSFRLLLTPLRTPWRTGVDNESIEPLTALPPPLELGPFDLAPDGSFDAQFPEVQVTGKANVFSPNDLKAVVRLKGRFSEDPASSPEKLGFVCGTMEGQVTSPIALDLVAEECFFAMTKLDESGTLPTAFPYNCAGDMVEEFPEE